MHSGTQTPPVPVQVHPAACDEAMPQHQVAFHDSQASASLSIASSPARGHIIFPHLTLGNAPNFRVSDPQAEGSAVDTHSAQISWDTSLQSALVQDAGAKHQVGPVHHVTFEAGTRTVTSGLPVRDEQDTSLSQTPHHVMDNVQCQPADQGTVQASAVGKAAIPVEEALVIELFAGSANLSKAFRSIGMQVIPVDARDAPQIKIVKLNLLHKGSLDLVFRPLDTRNVIMVHMAPPRSTSSQARRIQRHHNDPKPLRH